MSPADGRSRQRRLTSMLSTRFKPAEAVRIAKAAEERGVPQSQFVREAALDAAGWLGAPERRELVPASQTVNVTSVTRLRLWWSS